jgi:lipoyl(octanoyl) transferase
MTTRGYVLDLGVTEYRDAEERQLKVHRACTTNLTDDTLILTEHFPVYTLGRTSRSEHLGQVAQLASIRVYPTDRGGSVTYHGPGQLVGYPIFRLQRYCRGPKTYMSMLEEVLIRSIRTLGLDGVRRSGMPGVWIGEKKIAAMGVRISEGVTRHGFALNVTNDLTPFSKIVPCGLVGYGITSIALETGGAVIMDAVKESVIEAFQNVFDIALEQRSESRIVVENKSLAWQTAPTRRVPAGRVEIVGVE